MTIKHLYIDLDKTLLPYDSFPKFVPPFLFKCGVKGLLYFPLICIWAMTSNRPKIRPLMAQLIKNKDSLVFDKWARSWALSYCMKDIHKNLIPPIPFSLASMSMDMVVEPLAQSLKAENALSSRFGRDDTHRYTGELSSPQCGGDGKAQMIREDTEARGYTLEEVGLLTDHHRDIPALDIVGHPLLVAPTPKLIEWNKTKQVPVLEYHKEVNWNEILK